MIVHMPDDTRDELMNCVRNYRGHLQKVLIQPVQNAMGFLPRELTELIDALNGLEATLNPRNQHSSVDLGSNGSMLLSAIMYVRKQVAIEVESKKSVAVAESLHSNLGKRLEHFDHYTTRTWYPKDEPYEPPAICEYISTKTVELHFSQDRLSNREYDEKFHILQAPRLFYDDLAYYRATCDRRKRPVSVAYLDIDNFKHFNTKYGEPRVDRQMLPTFMSTLEAHVHSHGHAYRFGGDEYVILLPNTDRGIAIRILNGLRSALGSVEYVCIEENPTVSVGLCEIGHGLPLTERECEDRAARAKTFAKDKGKDRIAAYGDRFLTASTLQIVGEEG